MESVVEKINDQTFFHTDTTYGTLDKISPDEIRFRVQDSKVLFTSPLKNFQASRLTIRNGDQLVETVFPGTFSKLEEEILLGFTVRYLKSKRTTDVYGSPMDGVDNHEVYRYELEVLDGPSKGCMITSDIQSGDREFRRSSRY